MATPLWDHAGAAVGGEGYIKSFLAGLILAVSMAIIVIAPLFLIWKLLGLWSLVVIGYCIAFGWAINVCNEL